MLYGWHRLRAQQGRLWHLSSRQSESKVRRAGILTCLYEVLPLRHCKARIKEWYLPKEWERKRAPAPADQPRGSDGEGEEGGTCLPTDAVS